VSNTAHDHPGGALARYVPTGVGAVDRAVQYWGQGSLLPKQYRLPDAQGGGVDWPNLTIAATALQVLDVEPFPNLPDTYVVNGRLGLMHGLQVALAQRADVFPDLVESNEERAVVELVHGRSWGCPRCAHGGGHTRVVTMAQATKAGWPRRNPNYGTMPDRMLAARAMTAAIDAHAPGVLRGIASTMAPVVALEGAEDSAGVDTPPTPPPGVVPAPAEYMTREAPDALRAELVDRLQALEARNPAMAAELRAEWKSLRGPVVAYDSSTPAGRRAFLPDVLVLRYMLEEYEGVYPRTVPYDYGDGVDRPNYPPAPGVVDPTAHDDAPQGATDPDAGANLSDPDPGRPY
jgi:hypothetical protein